VPGLSETVIMITGAAPGIGLGTAYKKIQSE